MLASLLPSGLSPTLLINIEPLRPDKFAFWLALAAPSSNVIVRSGVWTSGPLGQFFVGESLQAPHQELPDAVGRPKAGQRANCR